MRLHRNLTVQVLFSISVGIALGLMAPDVARRMKPVGDTFVNLVKMVITPIIFLTIVAGIANVRDVKRVGRVGGKALLYFEIVTTYAAESRQVHAAECERAGFEPKFAKVGGVVSL